MKARHPSVLASACLVVAACSPAVLVAQTTRLGYEGNIGATNPHPDPGFQSFGAGIASGDFDDDGVDDLVILESTNSRMRVMRGQNWTVGDPGFQIKFQSTSVDTPGHNGIVATGDFNNDGKDEIALGYPAVGFNGATEVGRVSILGRAANNTWTTQATIRIGTDGYAGTGPLQNDRLGYALASGDFNDDGYDDLAMGAATRTASGQSGAGSVLIAYGSASGLTPTGSQLWNRSNSDVGAIIEASDRFGATLAVGDFTDDGPDDLVIAATSARCPNGQRGGSVIILRGSSGGVTATDSRAYFAGVNGTPGTCTDDNRFGRSLATGRFNDDQRPDLAIGSQGAAGELGNVTVLASGTTGPGPNSSRHFRGSDLPGGTGTIGYVLTAGRLRGGMTVDDILVLGLPYESVNGLNDAGSVWVIYPAANGSGLSLTGAERWVQNPRLALAPMEWGDRFGSSLAIGDFNGDSRNDLAIGAVYRATPETHGGAVQFLYQSDFIFRDSFN